MMAALLALPALAQDVPGYINVPGTDTKVHVYGYAQFYAQLNMNQNEGALGGIGTGDSQFTTGAIGNKSQFYMSANGSRLGVATISSSTLGDISTKLEWDNNGSGNAKYGAWEVRHAAMSVGNFTIGQTDSLFSDPDAGLNAIDSNGYLGGMNWDTGRFPLVKYVTKLDDKNTLGVSLEQNSQSGGNQAGAPTFYSVTPAGASLAQIALAASATADNKLPSLVAAYTFADSWGHVRVSAVEQSWGFRVGAGTTADRKESTVTSTLGLGTKVLIGKDNVSATLVTGKGSGAYSQGDGKEGNSVGYSNYDLGTSTWNLIKTTGWQASYTHVFTDKVTSSIGAAGFQFSNDPASATVAPLHLKSWMGAYANCQVQLTKTFNYAVEYKYEKITAQGSGNVAWDANGIPSGNTENASTIEFVCAATF